MNRFWSKVDIGSDDQCWIWKARKETTKFQYGRFSFNGRNEHAHRVSYLLSNGEIPKGLYVLHTCDNPTCVNPKHLFLGTSTDNMRDMESKGRGRHPSLENGSKAKLTNDQAAEIFTRGNHGEKRCDLAKEFGISSVAVSYICIGRNWKGLQAYHAGSIS